MQHFNRDSFLVCIFLIADPEEKNKLVRTQDNMKQYMPGNSFHEASNLSFKKSLVNFMVMNEVIQELNQCDEPIFTLCDKGTDIGDAVQDEDIQFLVPDFPDIDLSYDILCELWELQQYLARRLVFFAVGTDFGKFSTFSQSVFNMVKGALPCRGMMGKGMGTGVRTIVGINSIKEGPGTGWEFDIDSIEVDKHE
ncbi:hypothetical protein L208DRAFT_1375354 [Tricholoma matsutake]|nr:hypothetical protein L208DRAFT_1375354 [Tricholoma matsutake 945]